ncbi:hypothetical protein ACQY0O_004719 [Thecaphora frezii]
MNSPLEASSDRSSDHRTQPDPAPLEAEAEEYTSDAEAEHEVDEVNVHSCQMQPGRPEPAGNGEGTSLHSDHSENSKQLQQQQPPPSAPRRPLEPSKPVVPLATLVGESSSEQQSTSTEVRSPSFSSKAPKDLVAENEAPNRRQQDTVISHSETASTSATHVPDGDEAADQTVARSRGGNEIRAPDSPKQHGEIDHQREASSTAYSDQAGKDCSEHAADVATATPCSATHDNRSGAEHSPIVGGKASDTVVRESPNSSLTGVTRQQQALQASGRTTRNQKFRAAAAVAAASSAATATATAPDASGLVDGTRQEAIRLTSSLQSRLRKRPAPASKQQSEATTSGGRNKVSRKKPPKKQTSPPVRTPTKADGDRRRSPIDAPMDRRDAASSASQPMPMPWPPDASASLVHSPGESAATAATSGPDLFEAQQSLSHPSQPLALRPQLQPRQPQTAFSSRTVSDSGSVLGDQSARSSLAPGPSSRVANATMQDLGVRPGWNPPCMDILNPQILTESHRDYTVWTFWDYLAPFGARDQDLVILSRDGLAFPCAAWVGGIRPP